MKLNDVIAEGVAYDTAIKKVETEIARLSGL